MPSGRSVPIPYNGSVARLSFGPMSYTKVRRWIRAGQFDVLHVHEPVAPSLSMLALMVADGPIVATFHTANPRSRMLAAFQGVLQPFLEKITGRIAVSELARQVQVEHLGGDAVIIPNGVDVQFFAGARPLPGYPRPGGTIGFIGRFDEPRKGMDVLLDALRLMVARPARPAAAGRRQRRREGPAGGGRARAAAGALRFLGRVSDADKASMLRSLDVYCAPNTGGESFGIILTEAMSAGTPVVASDLDAFRRVLDGGIAGRAEPRSATRRRWPGAVGGAGRPGPAGRARRAGPAGGRRLRLAGRRRDGGQGLRDRGRRRSAGWSSRRTEHRAGRVRVARWPSRACDPDPGHRRP